MITAGAEKINNTNEDLMINDDIDAMWRGEKGGARGKKDSARPYAIRCRRSTCKVAQKEDAWVRSTVCISNVVENQAKCSFLVAAASLVTIRRL